MKVTTDSCFLGAWAAEEIKNEELKIKNVLDIGTGTGLLSLMIAQKNDVKIDAVEIDREASQQAKENVEASPWKERIHIFNEDIRSFQPAKKYDCIISNPPFYENELTSETQTKNIAHHSEQLTIAEVLRIIKAHLKEDGIFFLMYPFKRNKEIEQLLTGNELYALDSAILSQSVRHSPFRAVIKGTSRKEISTSTESMSIWDEHQQYTKSFVDVLKDYYLYL
ncbi:MAG: methyltransferase [Flavisolibacter sp.]|nr:methyltransferase [Flavisolibacter sp.]